MSPPRHAAGALLVGLAGVLALSAGPAFGAQPTTAAAEQEMIQLNFPENLEVKVLIDYVARRREMNLL